jgi:imidazole glycerol phosphate synthase subunit HisF
MSVIARIDVKNEYAIKGIHLEGVRKVGDPNELALKYYVEGIDEVVFMDAVASLCDRNNLFKTIESACAEVFIPVTIGGGIGQLMHISDLANQTCPSGLACAASCHYNKTSVSEIKNYMQQNQIEVRI